MHNVICFSCRKSGRHFKRANAFSKGWYTCNVESEIENRMIDAIFGPETD